MFTPREFKKFFIIQCKNQEQTLEDIHMFRANNKIIETLKGRPKRITMQRNGSILLEVKNYEQSLNVRKISALDGTEVVVSEHRSLNQTKGTIRNKEILKYTDEEIVEDMKKNNKYVSSIYRLKTKRNKILTDTGTFIVNFDCTTLPETMIIGWIDFEVREYIPRPRRCFKCQRFSHSSNTCSVETPICVNCALEAHEDLCQNPTKCANCDGEHRASDRDCFYYKLEQEIISVQTRQKIPRIDARREVMKRYVRPSTSFADALRQDLPVSRPTSTPTSMRTPQNTANITSRQEPTNSPRDTSPTNNDNDIRMESIDATIIDNQIQQPDNNNNNHASNKAIKRNIDNVEASPEIKAGKYLHLGDETEISPPHLSPIPSLAAITPCVAARDVGFPQPEATIARDGDDTEHTVSQMSMRTEDDDFLKPSPVFQTRRHSTTHSSHSSGTTHSSRQRHKNSPHYSDQRNSSGSRSSSRSSHHSNRSRERDVEQNNPQSSHHSNQSRERSFEQK